MPPSNARGAQITTQYPVICEAGADPFNPQSHNYRRVFLEIQNVGVNAGSFWFERQSNAGQAIVLVPLASRTYEINCPLEAVYYQSTLGTMFAVIEGTRQEP